MYFNQVFRIAYRRLCQFHVMQAIVRWANDPGVAKIRIRLSKQDQVYLQMKFREIQRARSVEEFAGMEQRFFEDLSDYFLDATLVMNPMIEDNTGKIETANSGSADDDDDGGEDNDENDEECDGDDDDKEAAVSSINGQLGRLKFERVSAYLKKNWFTSFWIRKSDPPSNHHPGPDEL